MLTNEIVERVTRLHENIDNLASCFDFEILKDLQNQIAVDLYHVVKSREAQCANFPK